MGASSALLVNMVENHIKGRCILTFDLHRTQVQFNNQLTLINQEVR